MTRRAGTARRADRPGREVGSEHRQVIEDLIDSQGWRYRRAAGRGYPRLYPADRSESAIQSA